MRRKIHASEEDPYGGIQLIICVLAILCAGAIIFGTASYWLFVNSGLLRDTLLTPTAQPTPIIDADVPEDFLLTVAPLPPPIAVVGVLQGTEAGERRRDPSLCPLAVCALRTCFNDEQCTMHVGGGHNDAIAIQRCHPALRRCAVVSTCNEYADGRAEFSPCLVSPTGGACMLGVCRRQNTALTCETKIDAFPFSCGCTCV